MTNPIASLPMYDWPEIRDETDALWSAIAGRFREAGVEAPDELNLDCEGIAHWLNSDMLFSQTCGYPFATKLMDKVDLLGSPVYAVEGCYGANYSSAIVVRADDRVADIHATKGHRFAFNGEDSLSGFRCLSPLIGDPLDHFNSSAKSGGHRTSAQMVANGEADIAALDAVCWSLLNSVESETAGQLRVLRWGPLFPALPFITRKGRDSEKLVAMRKALRLGVADSRDELHLLRLRDIESVAPETYQPLALF